MQLLKTFWKSSSLVYFRSDVLDRRIFLWGRGVLRFLWQPRYRKVPGSEDVYWRRNIALSDRYPKMDLPSPFTKFSALLLMDRFKYQIHFYVAYLLTPKTAFLLSKYALMQVHSLFIGELISFPYLHWDWWLLFSIEFFYCFISRKF